MTEYCARTDGRLSYDEAIKACRERFLAGRLPGENARDYRARVQGGVTQAPDASPRQVAE